MPEEVSRGKIFSLKYCDAVMPSCASFSPSAGLSSVGGVVIGVSCSVAVAVVSVASSAYTVTPSKAVSKMASAINAKILFMIVSPFTL